MGGAEDRQANWTKTTDGQQGKSGNGWTMNEEDKLMAVRWKERMSDIR